MHNVNDKLSLRIVNGFLSVSGTDIVDQIVLQIKHL